MCPKLTQYETHKHYIAGSLKPWSPSASWVRGVSMGGPIALWTKDYNGFCDVSCSPLQRLAWLKAISLNGTCSRPSDVAWISFRKNDFKIDYLFYTTNIGGHWCLQSYYNGFCDVSCSPLQRLAWLKAISLNGTCSRPSDVAWISFRENDFKIDYLFYTTNIGGHWCLQSYLTSYCEKRLGIWTWI